MNKLTGHISRKVVYDPWELCGLDNVCKRPCLGCKIPNIIFKLMRYEDTGWEPEELNKKILHEYAYGWIPCSERLPEREGVYLGTLISSYSYNSVALVGWSDGWIIPGGTSDIIAWMPCPLPYEEGDDHGSD